MSEQQKLNKRYAFKIVLVWYRISVFHSRESGRRPRSRDAKRILILKVDEHWLKTNRGEGETSPRVKPRRSFTWRRGQRQRQRQVDSSTIAVPRLRSSTAAAEEFHSNVEWVSVNYPTEPPQWALRVGMSELCYSDAGRVVEPKNCEIQWDYGK